jgi:potassium large conductance calcium-activated channel subfamily M alpha protein 1
MVDVLTVIPIFVTFGTEMPNVNYVYTARDGFLYAAYAMNTTRILRALRIRRKLAKIEDAVERFMGELLLSIIVMILFFASVMQFLEYTYQPHTYHTWMYYIWVTISTVGYGDITPKSTQGRIAVMCIIGFSIISIPKMTNELIEKMALQTVYMRNTYTPKSKNSKHIVICGDISSISLNEFFAELFHEDHENVDLNAILLLPTPPTTEMIFLLRDSSFFLNLQYLEGSALIDNDLKRAKAHLALAIFIMTNKFSNKPDEEDAKSILLNLSIKRYVASFHLPPKLFCLQLIRPSNRKHLGRDGPADQQLEEKDLVVCLNEIKMGVLAKAVMYPGANTLLMNLISSFSDDEIPEGEGAGQSSKWLR